ncbi:CoA-acylating methylmalonate-semialdehyde dehydrogenase [Lampropedia aestuarii]|uniref:CoA-acylating methylmalonate-semialdehyde dehydrogenase n=1 Tax=Lampropedia aestuarii TaxID=2562762 RepID=A0A4S5BK37_9BURK|nr:CoA-acylating methylmalonate-semialdehyde dehydrogenase [Lampropedia aestuarii]MDH5857234.1 CoA-acylating methylmalonate-semialdehyde dehydrogenase [Lampropedia aestuarii]THJ32847.1 CoA-acylating methylmalonate-semialdehyde dehydrogenase [Lampropedia aestuarii]
MKTIGHFIGGQHVTGPGLRHAAVYNPSTGSASAQLDMADRRFVDEAIAKAAKAQQAWGSASHAHRVAVMYKFRELLIANTDALAEIIGQENGKTIQDAKGELARALEAVEFATNAPAMSKGEFSRNVGGGIDVYSMRVPLGVVACIAPFNFPVMVPLMMSTMAMAVGNAVILKPSEKVPSAALALGDLWKQAGLPDGIWNVVNGDKEVVDALLEHPDIAAVCFVGSTSVGEYIYHKGTAHNKRVGAYTGGKNHMIVMPDADLEAAASGFVTAGYGSASQRCMALSVLVAVGDETAERLKTLLKPLIQALKVGPYNDSQADFGAVISAQSKAAIENAIAAGVQDGAQLVVDGRQAPCAGDAAGFYVGASLLDHVRPDMPFYQEEVFGPARALMRVNSLDEALQLTNSHQYGNGAVIYTRSGASANRFVSEVDAGGIGVNVPVPVPVGYHNFGGLRRSRFGEAHLFGPDALRFYTKLKTVSQRWPEQASATPTSLAFPGNE